MLSVTVPSDSGKMVPVTRNNDLVRTDQRAALKTEPQNRNADKLMLERESANRTRAAKEISRAASGPDQNVPSSQVAAIAARPDLSGKRVLLKASKKTARTEKQSVACSTDSNKGDCGTGRDPSTSPAGETENAASSEIHSNRASATMIVARKAGPKEAVRSHGHRMDEKRIEKGHEQSKLPDGSIQRPAAENGCIQPTVKEVFSPLSTVDEKSGRNKKKTTLSPISGANNRAFTRVSEQDSSHRAVSRFSLERTPTAETFTMHKQADAQSANAKPFIKSFTGSSSNPTGSPGLPPETIPARKPAIVWRKTVAPAFARKLFSSGARDSQDNSFSLTSNESSGDFSAPSPEPGLLSQNGPLSSAAQAAGQKTGIDLELLAEQVSCLISRRLAVEQERRGVGI
jgi:hypothetical protein